MKISDITQRSQAQHIAEGREQLDEAIFMPAVWAALGVAGAGYTAYETWQNYQAHKRGEIDKKELIARVGGDVALGLIGGGGLAVAKALGKGAWRGGKALLGMGGDAKAAAKELKKAKEIQARADKLGKTTKPDLPDSSGKGSTLLGKGKRIYKTNKAKRKADKGVKTANKKLDKTKIMPRVKKRDFAKGAVVGLAVPDSLDPLRDPAYKALGGADPHGQPKAGESLADAEARRKADAAAEQKRKVRFMGLSSHRSGAGVIGQDQYDITSQQIKKWKKEKEKLVKLEKEAKEAAADAKAEKQAN
jgi:hypothetical protein